MRSSGRYHPQWGYLAPAPSFVRTVRTVLVSTAVGAIAGAAVVVSLVGRPSTEHSRMVEASVTATARTTKPTITMQPRSPVPAQATIATLPPAVDTGPTIDMARSEARTISTASRQALDGAAPMAIEDTAAPVLDQATRNPVTSDQAVPNAATSNQVGPIESHIRVGHVARRQKKRAPIQWRREQKYFAPQGDAYQGYAYQDYPYQDQGYAYESAPFYRRW